MSYEEVNNLMQRLESKLATDGISSEEINRWVADEREAAMALSTLHNPGGIEEFAEATQAASTNTDNGFGSIPVERENGSFRGLYVQLNNIATTTSTKTKSAKLCKLIRKYDPHCIGLGEVGRNWSLFKDRERLESLLSDLGRKCRSCRAYNELERGLAGKYQSGGTGMIVLDELIPYSLQGGNDPRKLGRWCSYILSGRDGAKCRIVTAYPVGNNKSQSGGSVYQQQIRYVQENGISMTPKKLFESDFLGQIKRWRDAGEKLIIMIDMNEHANDGSLARKLSSEEFGLINTTQSLHSDQPSHTFVEGSTPIDAIWHSPDVDVTSIRWLPFHESPGDHMACVFEFTTSSAIGNFEQKIVYPACRRLNTRVDRVMERYGQLAEEQFRIHRIMERLDKLEREMGDTYPPSAEHTRAMDKLDSQVVEIQHHCEKKCRKIYRGDAAFSVPIKVWNDRVQIYNRLLRMHEGKVHNIGTLCRLARKRGIARPRQLTVEQLIARRDAAKAKRREMKKMAPALRQEHLRNLLVSATAKGQTKRVKAIKAIMDREGVKRMWWCIQHDMSEKSGKSVTRVEQVVDGVVVEHTEEQDVVRCIQQETEVRFQLANSTPICQGLLGEELGYLADTETAQQILNGRFELTPDIDDATGIMLEEIARIGAQLTNGEIIIEITPDDFREYWRRAKETTSSSYSGIHFGHYKAAGNSDLLSRFFSKKISLIAKCGCPPSRWGVGLTVMLEKIAGIALVNKLRAILLMEADFNRHNRIIFGNRMIHKAREEGLIPPEIFSTEGNTAEDGSFGKGLMTDISRQSKTNMAITSNDAESCYNRIAHAMLSLILQAMTVGRGAIAAMLIPIQIMCFFLRTGFGESKTSMGGDPNSRTQGLCQGNTASPAGWEILCATMLRCHQRRGHGALLISPMSLSVTQLMGIWFVDDCDLITMAPYSPGEAVWDEAQEALDS
jgi:hypothetical protein